jgi:hypothetical protein
VFAGRRHGAIKPISSRQPPGKALRQEVRLSVIKNSGQSHAMASPDRNVAGQIGREIADAGGPAHGKLRNKVAGRQVLCSRFVPYCHSRQAINRFAAGRRLGLGRPPMSTTTGGCAPRRRCGIN